MTEATSSENLVFWLAAAFLSAMLWGAGFIAANQPSHFVTVPRWILILCGIRQGKQADYRKLEVQMFGIVLFVWSTILTILVQSQKHRNDLFAWGFLVGIIGVVLLDIVLTELSRRSHRD